MRGPVDLLPEERERMAVFGYVMADPKMLSKEELRRYRGVYCGICEAIRTRCSGASRLALSYDMVFLVLLLSSLYEPEERETRRRCGLHPVRAHAAVSGDVVSYAADLNVALAFYSARDHWLDDRRFGALAVEKLLARQRRDIAGRYPAQCAAMENCIHELSELERTECVNPDEPASCFGVLMTRLFRFREDYWIETVDEMAFSLGRFVYLMDAVMDYETDRRRGRYNPFLASGIHWKPEQWEEVLILEMSRCTAAYERLPLVQDKTLMDKILYNGVWTTYRDWRKRTAREEQKNDTGSV